MLERRGKEVPAIEGVVRWIVPDNIRNVTEDDVPVYPPRRNLSLTVRGETVRIKL